MGDLGASSWLGREDGGRAGSKIENEHKKHKKRGAGQIAVEHSSAKGQFIFVCYINFLLRLLASTISPPLVLLAGVPTPAAANLRSIRVSSLKTVNSARHQGECELARAVLSAPIKMAMKKTRAGSVVRSFLRALVRPIYPPLPLLRSGVQLNGSYARDRSLPSFKSFTSENSARAR